MSKASKKQTEASESNKTADLGVLLRAKREQKQLSIGEVSERLKLPARQIEALENGDYNSLPEPVFVRGFLRSYGRFLDLDESTLNEALANIAPSEKTRKAHQGDNGLNFANEKPKRPFPTWIFGIIGVAIIGFGVYKWQTKSQTEHATAKQEAESKPLIASETAKPALDNPNVVVKPMTASDTQTQTAASSASAPVGVAGELVINARYRTMLTVTNAKGEVLINEIVPSRSEHRFQNGAPFEVRLGYANGSTATFGGQPIDMNAARKNGKTATFAAGASAPQ